MRVWDLAAGREQATLTGQPARSDAPRRPDRGAAGPGDGPLAGAADPRPARPLIPRGHRPLGLYRGLGHRLGEAVALTDLGSLQRLTGGYPAAATSLQQAIELGHDLGHRLQQAMTLNSLGELSSRTLASHRARDQHTEALAIARDLGVPLEEARALEGIGRSHLQDGDRGQAAAHLRQALTIYQRIGAPRPAGPRNPPPPQASSP